MHSQGYTEVCKFWGGGGGGGEAMASSVETFLLVGGGSKCKLNTYILSMFQDRLFSLEMRMLLFLQILQERKA